MGRRMLPWLLSLLLIAAAVAVAAAAVKPAPLYLSDLRVRQADIRFDGDRAYRWTAELVTRYPLRHAGGPNSKPAADWLAARLTDMGYRVEVDRWTIPLYGRPVELHNVVAYHPRSKPGPAILLEAHHDHAPTTFQGADNDGSGVGILLHLAELLADEELNQPVFFLFADAEEYGMLGVRRFMSRQKDPSAQFAAALALDNAGKASAFGAVVDVHGQGRGHAPLSLIRLLQDLAPVAESWAPYPPPPDWQIIARTVQISLTDQGPMLAEGVPALSLGATGVWPHYHSPGDTLEQISADTLGRVGRLTEAFVRELQAGRRLERSPTQYLYLANPVPKVGEPGWYVPGWAISLVQLTLLAPFLAAVWLAVRRVWGRPGFLRGLAGVLPGTIPPLAGWLVLPLLVRAGWIPAFAFYPAPPRDPVLTQVSWPGVAGFVAAVALGVAAGRWVSRRTGPQGEWQRPAALLVMAGLALAVWLRNGYALVFLLPALYAWLLMGRVRLTNLSLLAVGGAGVYALLWFFGQRILHIGPYMTWYFLQMLAFGVVAPYTALAGCLAVGCGVSLGKR